MQDVNLQTERQYASAVVLPNGELWIQGGGDGNYNIYNILSTSETMSLQGSQPGMELEKAIAGHCSMMINATTAFITGGYTGSSSRETYFIDIQNWKLTKGPQMEEARHRHGCAVFMHSYKNYAVVAGGEPYPYLSSTEILDLDSLTLGWTKGKWDQSLPQKSYLQSQNLKIYIISISELIAFKMQVSHFYFYNWDFKFPKNSKSSMKNWAKNNLYS